MATKTSSKASSPSWRTLRRQADQAPTSAQAAALIKEANKLRRAKRAKTKATAMAGLKKSIRKGTPELLNEVLYGDQSATMRQGGPTAQAQGWAPLPTPDEQIAQNRAKEIVVLARTKNLDLQDIVRRFECWNRLAEINARKEAEVINLENTKFLTKQMHINVVASFIAQVNGMAAANRGPLPRSMVISGYVLARVVDALTQAGYTEDGFKSDGIRRLDREAVVNDMVASRTRR